MLLLSNSLLQPLYFLIELAKQLQSLARKGDPSLLSVFQASFDGIAFNQETFDVKFFLENAQAIVNEKK
jgi:hypothetical protein